MGRGWDTLSTRDVNGRRRSGLRGLVIAELNIARSRCLVVITVWCCYRDRAIATVAGRVTVQGVSMSNSGDSW